MTPIATKPITTKVERTEIMQVRNVIVETQGPNGRALSSHRSAQCGQISGFQMGARMGIFAVFGMQLVDVGHQLHGPSLKQAQPS